MTLLELRWTTFCFQRLLSKRSSPWTTRSMRRWRPSTLWRPTGSSSSTLAMIHSCCLTIGCSLSVKTWRPWRTWWVTCLTRKGRWTITISPGWVRVWQETVQFTETFADYDLIINLYTLSNKDFSKYFENLFILLLGCMKSGLVCLWRGNLQL